MGNLLKVLHCKDEGYDVDLFLDFEDARPTEAEKEIHDSVSIELSFAPEIILELKNYKGAIEAIRVAISNPSDEIKQKDAWEAVLPLVEKLKKFFEFSTKLEKCSHELLHALTEPSQSPLHHLETKQALAKQFAEILKFTLTFDELKMNNPAIQNDFSYFRRIMSRKGMSNSASTIDYSKGNFISTELANKMSLFYAEATPMLKTISTSTKNYVLESGDINSETTSDVLSTMANICKVMLENPDNVNRFQMGDNTVFFCLRVMVGVIILYDHIHPLGAFCKGSRIDIKGSIKVLRDQNEADHVRPLINALRYTTKHLNDVDTPKAIKTLLATSA